MTRLRVAIVAPTLEILGGQSIQADRLLHSWRGDPDIDAWLVPVNPVPHGWLRHAVKVKYARTIVTELTYLPRLVRELGRADVVHIFSASYASFVIAPLPAIATARLLGRPVVLNYHSGEAPDHLARSAIARGVLRRTDINVVPSRFLVDVFASFGLEALAVANTIDLERFRFRPRPVLAPRLLSTRSFDSNYNVACALRAFALVQARIPDAVLTLVGGGPHENRLRALAATLGLRGVTFAGRVSPDDMPRYYAAHDIFVQTPAVDNMPLSVLEAFASGLPVVSTEAGGVPTILSHGVHGLLAPLDDHAAVAAQVLRLLDEPDLAQRLATRARESCDAYVWSAVRKDWLAVYRRAARAKSDRADDSHGTRLAQVEACQSRPLQSPSHSSSPESSLAGPNARCSS